MNLPIINLTVFVNSTNIYTNIETAMLSSLVTLPTTQCLPKGLVRVTLAFLKITFGKVFGWKCKEIFCYWTKVSSEEWWSVCFSFVTACISPLRKIFLPEQKQGWCKITNSLWLSWSFLFFPPPCRNMQKSLVKS